MESVTPSTANPERQRIGFLFKAIILTGLAAGMGWGIRGQYGHETGAMIAGALASLTLVLLFVPHASSLAAARAAAMMTIGIGIGGTMTYGQTIGLTQSADLIGNWEALRWGLFGLFIKGGLWIGFAGAFLGMGLGGHRYRPLEMGLLVVAMIVLVHVGVWLLNSPYDPANKVLPRIYFSASWYFQPEKADLNPRREVWGGLAVGLVALTVYLAAIRRDRLGWRMGCIGFVAGGLGFAGGQCVQAFHAWNADLFSTGLLSGVAAFKFVNWWNMMETSFGLIFGAVMATGLWLNQSHIRIEQAEQDVSIDPTSETALLCAHLGLLLTSEFLRLPGPAAIVSSYVDMGFYMCLLPMIGVAGGRAWPYLLLFPVVVAPICGKQLRHLVYGENPEYSIAVGWVLFAIIPLSVALVTAVHLLTKGTQKQSAKAFAALGLLMTVIIYFGFNTAFFNFAWPWQPWTARTPSQTIFGFCSIVLSLTAISQMSRRE